MPTSKQRNITIDPTDRTEGNLASKSARTVIQEAYDLGGGYGNIGASVARCYMYADEPTRELIENSAYAAMPARSRMTFYSNVIGMMNKNADTDSVEWEFAKKHMFIKCAARAAKDILSTSEGAHPTTIDANIELLKFVPHADSRFDSIRRSALALLKRELDRKIGIHHTQSMLERTNKYVHILRETHASESSWHAVSGEMAEGHRLILSNLHAVSLKDQAAWSRKIIGELERDGNANWCAPGMVATRAKALSELQESIPYASRDADGIKIGNGYTGSIPDILNRCEILLDNTSRTSKNLGRFKEVTTEMVRAADYPDSPQSRVKHLTRVCGYFKENCGDWKGAVNDVFLERLIEARKLRVDAICQRDGIAQGSDAYAAIATLGKRDFLGRGRF